MFIKIEGLGNGDIGPLAIRCPKCGSIGVFHAVSGRSDFHVGSGYWLGSRVCPNPSCMCHLFFIRSDAGAVTTYPALRVDFDSKGIPEAIVRTFSDALTCHAEKVYVAAAIMIRRTLEELCEDKGATGNSLQDRIATLQANVILPKELFAALDDLRLLGNDAAHVEAKAYDTIGQAEIEVAIELTKEILKAVYQLDSLVSRLRALKKP